GITVAQGSFTASLDFTWAVTDTPLLQPESWSLSVGQTVTEDPRTSYGQSNSGLTYSYSAPPLQDLPAGLSLDSATGRITGTVDYTAVSSGTTSVYGANVEASTGTFSEAVTDSWVVYNKPLLQGNTWTVTEGESFSADPRTSYGQSASGLTYSSGTLPPGLTI